MRQKAFYPVDDIRTRKSVRASTQRPCKLRSSITPGTVLVLVSTKHRGKRVVFLKQLPSGLLLVIGPYGINGVPLLRVDQCHVIATSTKLDISSVEIPQRITDTYFSNKKIELKKALKENKSLVLVERQPKSAKPPTEHIEDANNIENQLKSVISSVPNIKKYLASHFSLSNGQYPHNLVF